MVDRSAEIHSIKFCRVSKTQLQKIYKNKYF
jgi:hypothetical protein